MTLRPFERLAADANVLLSAAAGGVALRVFHALSKEGVVTTDVNMAEMKEHLPEFVKRYHLDEGLVSRHLAVLPLTVFSEAGYGSHLEEAHRLIGRRDPDDAALLALALKLGIPIWSNDKDFDEAKLTVYTTAVVLKILEG